MAEHRLTDGDEDDAVEKERNDGREKRSYTNEAGEGKEERKDGEQDEEAHCASIDNVGKRRRNKRWHRDEGGEGDKPAPVPS